MQREKNTGRQGTPRINENAIKLENKKTYRVIGVLHELNPKEVQLRSVMCRQYYWRKKCHTSNWPQGGRLRQGDSTDFHTIT